MGILATLAILLSALLHATWNVAAKRSGGSITFAFQSTLITMVVWLPVNLLLWLSYPSLSPLLWDTYAWMIVATSAAVHAVYYVVLLRAYRAAPLSVVYPTARGTGPLLSCIGAIIVFKEHLTSSTVFGVALIVGGVILLTLRGASETDRAAIGRGIGWGVATGGLIALYTVVDAYAVKSLSIHPVSLDYMINALRLPMLLAFLPSIAQGFNWRTESLRPVMLVALLGPASYILVLAAMQLAPLSHVAPARELSLLFGVFFGGKFLQEGGLRQRIVAAACIAAGVIVLSSAR